jgi:predicted nucleic acid-binding protein
MAGNVIVDASFLIASLNRRDNNHAWAMATAVQYPPPWQTCEAVISEVYYLTEQSRHRVFAGLLRRRSLVSTFHLSEYTIEVLELLDKYSSVPMSLADACLVRMTEVLSGPTLLTTDTDFRIYRRHGRKTIPCIMPV